MGIRIHDAERGEKWGVEFAARMVRPRIPSVACDVGFAEVDGIDDNFEKPHPGLPSSICDTYYNVTPNLYLVGGVENLFDRTYLEHLNLRLPADTIGTARLLRSGRPFSGYHAVRGYGVELLRAATEVDARGRRWWACAAMVLPDKDTKRQYASVESTASQQTGALPRPKTPAMCLTFDRGCDVRRGVMRPRLTAGVLVYFSLGRRHIGFVHPGLRWWAAPPNLPWAIFGRPLRGLRRFLSVRVSQLAGERVNLGRVPLS